MPKVTLEIQNVSTSKAIPDSDSITTWIQQVVDTLNKDAELTVRIVDIEEIHTLNNVYRKKDKPTNVLSFPLELPHEIRGDALGDIVICAQVVEKEAFEQQKDLISHFAHMIIHGCLHLFGYDHQNDTDANVMEDLEINIMHSLGFANPYKETN